MELPLCCVLLFQVTNTFPIIAERCLQFQRIFIQKELIQAQMQDAVVVRPGLHGRLADDDLFEEILSCSSEGRSSVSILAGSLTFRADWI